MSQNVISSPFCNFKKKKAFGVGDNEFVHYKVVDKIVDPESFDPKYPDQYLVKQELVEYERVPIDEYINSFDSSVGLKNLLKGIVSKKQLDDLISRTQAESADIDITEFPSSELELEKLASSVDAYWEKIPDELKGSMTKEDFVKTITSKQIQAYVEAQVKAHDAAQAANQGGNE